MFCRVNIVDWHFLNNVFSMKSWSNLKINDSFRIYSSWAFWNTPNMSDLSDYWMRYSKFKYNQIFASDFSQRLSSCVLNMPSNENLKASICSLVTPLSSHVIKFIVHSIILIWQAMFSCPAWFWLYCIMWASCFWRFNSKHFFLSSIDSDTYSYSD